MVITVNFINIEITNFRNVHPMNLSDLLGPIENKDAGQSLSRKAVIWGPDDLLAQAMEFFLKAEDTWQVIRISADQSLEDLFEQIKRNQPDVIILHTGNCGGNTSLAIQLLQDFPNLRVITTSLEDNQMQVYSKYSIRVRNASDLLSIIEDRYFSDFPVKKEADKSELQD
jgi:predicted nuclease of predicted toxin-antitoxin system